MEALDYGLLVVDQKDVLADNCPTLLYLALRTLEIIVHFQKSHILSQSISMFDYFTIDNLYQFEQIEVSVKL